MNWVTVIGIIFIALGTCLTYLGVDISNKKTNKQFNCKIDQLSAQNTNLIEGSNNLKTQNAQLLRKIEVFQEENKKLKESLKQEMSKTFDLEKPSDVGGGIVIRSRVGSIAQHYNNALDEYKRGNLESAKDKLEFILEKAPDDTGVLNLLGVILNELGSSQEALKVLKKAYNISGDSNILNNIKLIEKYPGKKFHVKEIKE